MDVDKLSGLAIRGFFSVAIALFALACTEWTLSLFERSLLNRVYVPGRLLEFAAIALVFVIALELRQIREELRKPKV